MIPGLGSPIEIGLAVAVYMVAVVLVTELLKPILKMKGGIALLFSWAIGGLLFWALSAVGCYAVSWSSAILFVIVTGLCNTAYRWTRLKELLQPVRSLRGGLK